MGGVECHVGTSFESEFWSFMIWGRRSFLLKRKHSIYAGNPWTGTGTGNCNPYELEPVWTGTGMNQNRNWSVSIRNITAHLINDKDTSTAETCIVFNGKSAGNNPRWIYWSYVFSFFRPLGLRTRRLAGEDADVKIWRSKGLTPWFY